MWQRINGPDYNGDKNNNKVKAAPVHTPPIIFQQQ